MRKIFVVLCLLTVAIYSNAQNAIPNPGFENWNVNPNYDDPVGWGTINGLTYFLGVRTVTKATAAADIHSGSFAIQLESKTVPFQGVAPGIAATGTINPSTQAVDGGVAYNKRPISFTGWYKYQPNGVDTGSIDARLSKWNSGSQQREEVGTAEFIQTATVNNYTQFTVNFTYSSANYPDTLVITILTSSGANSSPNGTKMWVDDLAFELCTGFSASASSTNSTCTASNGSATVSVTAGTTPLSYSWSGGGTTITVAKPVGTYIVTVSDGNACSVTATTTVTANSVLLSATPSTTDATCTAADGSASVAVSLGTSPYTYSWSTGSTNSSITNVVAGVYNVTAHDVNGCSGTASANISSANTSLTFSATSTPSSCLSNTGTATASSISGTGPYTYLWTNGGTTATISSLPAGNYDVTVTDVNGCTGASGVAVTTPNGPSATSITTNVACNSDSTGAVDITVSGGTGTITYLWNNNSTAEDITSLPAGNYCVTMTDVNNCSFQLCATVTEPAPIAFGNPLITHVSCFGGNDGSIILTVTGGTAPYTYSGWTGGTNLAAGSYSVTVTDATSCSTSLSATITEPPPLTATSSVTDATSSSATDGSITVTPSGGTTPYTFVWNIGTGTNLTPGVYCYTVTDFNNCTSSGATGCDTVSAPSAITNLSDEKIKLYPNPASNKVIIETNSANDQFTFSIYNLEGRLVDEKIISGEKVSVDVKHLPTGLYTYQLKNISSERVSCGKLQIER